MKLCVDCRHMIHGHWCNLAPIPPRPSPVDGGHTDHEWCHKAREENRACGPEGKLWERAGRLKRWFNQEMRKSD
jgi:hypothetical protein